MDADALLREAALPAAHGSVLPPARAILDAIGQTRRASDRLLLYAGLRGIVGRAAPLLAEAERKSLIGLVEARSETPPLDRERAALLTLLHSVPRLPGDLPGSVLVLAVSAAPFLGEPFGVARPLLIQATYHGGESRFENAADDAAVFQGFQQGIRAALGLALVYGPRALSFAQLIHGCSFAGRMLGLPEKLPIQGASLGLAAAVAALSELIGVVVDPRLAFTGQVDLKGRLWPVKGIDLKLRAAHDRGARCVYLPTSNEQDIPAELRDKVPVRPIETLAEAIGEVLGVDRFREGLEQLHARVRPPRRVREEPWIVPAACAADRRRVLLTFVGKADPTGRYLGRDRAPVRPATGARQDEARQEREGPTLVTVRMVRPDVVYLLHTTQPEENNFGEQALATREFLLTENPDLDVRLVPLATVSDPSDYEQVVPAMDAAVAAIHAEQAGNDARWFVNISSGTPAIESTWHLLREWQRLDATLLQAREARWLRMPGETRIREVVLPHPPGMGLPGATLEDGGR